MTLKKLCCARFPVVLQVPDGTQL